MRQSLLRLLACPECEGDFTVTSAEAVPEPEGEIDEGGLACTRCGFAVPIVRGVPRFTQFDDYASAFGNEWTRWPRAQLDSATGLSESREKLQDAFTFPLADFAGKVVLDGGCGTGRFSEIALEEGAEVVCVDLSRAIDVARSNLGHFPNAHFIQADLFRLPLKRSFDIIFSLGVLHHTPNPPGAFEGIARLLKPGGVISVRLYASYNKAYVAVTEFYRQFTHRLPPGLLFKLCYIAVPLYYVNKVPLLGPFITRLLVPVSVRPHTHAWRVCNTYDLYSPQYTFFYTHAEVNDWLVRAGLHRARVVDPDGGVCFEAWRPAQVSVAA